MTPAQIETLRQMAKYERRWLLDHNYERSFDPLKQSLAREGIERAEALEAAVETAELFKLAEGAGTL